MGRMNHNVKVRTRMHRDGQPMLRCGGVRGSAAAAAAACRTAQPAAVLVHTCLAAAGPLVEPPGELQRLCALGRRPVCIALPADRVKHHRGPGPGAGMVWLAARGCLASYCALSCCMHVYKGKNVLGGAPISKEWCAGSLGLPANPAPVLLCRAPTA